MTRTLLALSLACALGPAFATSAPDAVAPADTKSDTPMQVRQLGTVDVTAALDQARNALSPDTGSSQYVIDQQAIAQLPLGQSTPLNQVLLQAPGVVQDSYGGLHVRGDHGNLQYRINGVIIPESISGFGQALDARTIRSVKLLDGALPAQYGLRTAAVVDITTKSGHQLGNGGSVGITGGSFGTLNPNVSLWGSSDRWSAFFTANYLESDAGIENPTASRKPIHDHTNQVKSFGDVSYLIDADTRLSFLFGSANNRFEIPNVPGQQPQFGYLDRTAFDSALLDARQNETTRFGVLALQGKLGGSTDYQVSLGQRYTDVDYMPDRVGELMFNGVASNVTRSNRASTLQADFATPLGDAHTLRYGLYGSFERAGSGNDAWVFPADADGGQTSTTPIEILDASRLTAKTWSAYVQDEWSLNEAWTLNLGLRGDRYRLTRTESQLSPRIGLVWQATGSTVVHAGYARYFTPPATEMITSENIARFDGTTNAVPDLGNNTPLAERSDYFDAGVQQSLGAWTFGLDAYYRKVHRLQDEGQFGSALVYSTFNYAQGRVKGAEFTVNYAQGPLSAYFNLAASKAIGERIITSQYNFDPDDLAYVNDHYIHLDHDQKLASSGGVSYALDERTRIGADYLFGSGLRRDGAVPNGDHLPAYFQLNLSVSHDFDFGRFGDLHTQLAVLNALDRSYELRDGSGIGVGAPQFGPRRGVYLSLQKDF
ncbi:TonB-dependent receptor [Fulvimonas yonginensis]|uniref:TonB-dependent receptor n=1 Tax=Fulvimonas yonginensis TaxID=1495200 RepID=A0ABU8JC21_9GAMM